MIDVKVLRDNPDVVRASQKARGEDVSLVDKALAADEIRRAAIVEFEALRAEQNTLSKSVGAAKGDEKAALLEKQRIYRLQLKKLKRRKFHRKRLQENRYGDLESRGYHCSYWRRGRFQSY